MGWFYILCFGALGASGFVYENPEEQLPWMLVDALKNPKFQQEVVYDLRQENQIYFNGTLSLLIQYIIKREVDSNLRRQRNDAIGRRIYSSQVMKLIDIAKDMPRNTSAADRIDTAYKLYISFGNKVKDDKMADAQVFHACVRLYDILSTAPKILMQLGRHQLAPNSLVYTLKRMNVKPIHLGIALLIQFHLRNTANFAINKKAVHLLSLTPERVGAQVMNLLKDLATKLLVVSELLDLHVSYASPMFRNSPPKTWLEIIG